MPTNRRPRRRKYQGLRARPGSREWNCLLGWHDWNEVFETEEEFSACYWATRDELLADYADSCRRPHAFWLHEVAPDALPWFGDAPPNDAEDQERALHELNLASPKERELEQQWREEADHRKEMDALIEQERREREAQT